MTGNANTRSRIDATIVVPTRGDEFAARRIAHLTTCLGDYPMLVVCNSEYSHALLDIGGVITTFAPGGGAARARNKAIEITQSKWIVFVDDDVIIDVGTIDTLLISGERASATIATARVLGAPGDAAEDAIYCNHVTFDRGSDPAIWDGSNQRIISPFDSWKLRVGAAFAVCLPSLRAFAKHVSFDETLSNGCFAGGAEDVDFFLQVIKAGGSLRYSPEAIAYHVFPNGPKALRHKLRQYALADGAYYAKWWKARSSGDVLGEVRAWFRRLSEYILLRFRHLPTVPLFSLVAEPAYKLMGGVVWRVRRLLSC